MRSLSTIRVLLFSGVRRKTFIAGEGSKRVRRSLRHLTQFVTWGRPDFSLHHDLFRKSVSTFREQSLKLLDATLIDDVFEQLHFLGDTFPKRISAFWPHQETGLEQLVLQIQRRQNFERFRFQPFDSFL